MLQTRKIWLHLQIPTAKLIDSKTINKTILIRVQIVVPVPIKLHLIKRKNQRRRAKSLRNWASNCLKFCWESASSSPIDSRKSRSHSLSMELSTENNWLINRWKWFKKHIDKNLSTLWHQSSLIIIMKSSIQKIKMKKSKNLKKLKKNNSKRVKILRMTKLPLKRNNQQEHHLLMNKLCLKEMVKNQFWLLLSDKIYTMLAKKTIGMSCINRSQMRRTWQKKINNEW